MRILRSVFSLMFIVAAALGSPVLVSGCSNSSSPSGIQVEANQKEQQLLHDQIQKGLAKRLVTKHR
jgi:outer membrane murein-binding lipoprotein Lpp